MDLIEVCRKQTNLTNPQISLLYNMANFIPFAASVSKQDAYLFTLTDDDELLLLEGISGQHKGQVLVSEKRVSKKEYMIWAQTLEEGRPLRGLHEEQWGVLFPMSVFPIIDNGGKAIGGIAFVKTRVPSTVTERDKANYHLLAETAYMAIMVPDQEHPELYRSLSYQDGVVIFDENGLILYANEAAITLVDLLGFDRRIVGASIFGGNLKLSLVKRALSYHQGTIVEEMYGDIVLEQTVLPVLSSGKVRRSFLFLKDCTARRKQERELLVKNSVIKEIHHRVKNNLQTVAGLLRLESRQASLPEVKHALQEGINRIESMALVHEAISHYDEDYISLRTISEELLRLLRQSMIPEGKEITSEYIGPDIIVSSHQASYISLVLNELITNSLDHGFITKNQGTVVVKATEMESDLVKIEVIDDGDGLPADFDWRNSNRLGLQIIKNLVENELDGEVTIVPDESGGTLATIVIHKGE